AERGDNAVGERARERIAHYLGRGVEKGRLTAEERDAALARLTTTTELSDLAGCDLVIEAVVEELGAKREIFAELDKLLPSAVLATNTSALPVGEIAAATEPPARVGGMHFFNPAPVLPLVEVVQAEASSDEAVESAFAFAELIGKRPIRCRGTARLLGRRRVRCGAPRGFVVNPILLPLLNDCVRVLEEASVTPDDLDTAM